MHKEKQKMIDQDMKRMERIEKSIDELKRVSRDRKVAAAWHLFKDYNQDRLWGPCGGDRSTEWTAGPGQELFNLENLSILLTQMSEEGIWNDETLRMVYDRAAYHNEVCTERDHDEWQAEQDRWLTFETSDEGEP